MKPPCKRTRPTSKARLSLPLLFSAAASIVMAQSAGTFVPTGDMTAARSGHTATLLADGRVLIAGGGQYPHVFASAELYDPSSGTFTATGDMTTPRFSHTATLLPDGRVLISGGGFERIGQASAELYDPSSGTFTATGNMISARGLHAAILLANGKVLIAGGWGPTGPETNGVVGAELYDPVTGTFAAIGGYLGNGVCENGLWATLLADGRVLFTGQSPAQLYDPATGVFSLTGPFKYTCHATGALLTNGQVLLAGRQDESGNLPSTELYDPATDSFASTGNMAWLRDGHTLTLLPGGMVLAAGGDTVRCRGGICESLGSAASTELYDPSTGTFAATGEMTAARSGHTATLLNDGRVLIAGGDSAGAYLLSAEIYNPAVLVPPPVLLSVPGDGGGRAAILHADTHQLVSAGDPAVAGEALEIYCTGLAKGSVIPPFVSIGSRLAEVLFFGKAPGYEGLNQVNVRVPSGIAPGPAVPVRLTYIGRSSNEVTVGVQ